MAQLKTAEKTITDLNSAKALSQAGDLVAKAVDVEGVKVAHRSAWPCRATTYGRWPSTCGHVSAPTRWSASSAGPTTSPRSSSRTGDGARAKGIGAGSLVGIAAPEIGGRGGGKDDFAQGGGTNGAASAAAFDAVVRAVREKARA